MAETRSPQHKVRFVTAAALFDGHDAAINVIRRLLVQRGAEVVHLGHNRSCQQIVDAAIEEDAQAIAVSSYQGGHVEFYTYILELLARRGCGHIAVFGGGGGVIVPEEIDALEAAGVEKIYSPADGQRLGLSGMIDDMIARTKSRNGRLPRDSQDPTVQASALLSAALASNGAGLDDLLAPFSQKRNATMPVVGVTGSGGAGKSSLLDEFVRRFVDDFPGLRLGLLAVDPVKRRTGGALLGDRIRMNAIDHSTVFLRSVALGPGEDLAAVLRRGIATFSACGFDLCFLETAGIGQLETSITEVTPLSLYVMTSEYGADTQLEKINMLDYASMILINKFEQKRAEDALQAVRKQYRRNFNLFSGVIDEDLPVFGTAANRFDDQGVNVAYLHLLSLLHKNHRLELVPRRSYRTERAFDSGRVGSIIPQERQAYLADLAETVRGYKQRVEQDAATYETLSAYRRLQEFGEAGLDPETASQRCTSLEKSLSDDCIDALATWQRQAEVYAKSEVSYEVRGKTFTHALCSRSLSGLGIPKVALPKKPSPRELVRYLLLENLPGTFPFTAGVFPFKRTDEEPKRQFAGEGPPERTNRRFHYLCKGEQAKRLSTAFDSVTLYGEDPAVRPDIFGKIGESGVSVATLDDMEKLYAGFDLTDPNCSVSMTINGPAPIMLAMYFNTAVAQQLERFSSEQSGRRPTEEEAERIRAATLAVVRGTVQADILKEDQAQNTCIFSTDFALRLMGDMQEFAIGHGVRNYYTVSISGYHIAEAGANPITQLAFTLSNGFTLVEYYLNRGMAIDDFAPNLSFFFSTGMDPEYSVMGRVARRIWAVTMRDRYGASERSQKLKYHIQTSGRSLHAQEIQFNDIRTTLQALTALADNCNSLHTNAYNEAITTPTERSVRNAMAIQLILTREFGQLKNENNLQGSYFYERLTDLVEEAVLDLFVQLSNRGGTLRAMETQFHRGLIQDESLQYEQLKHSGELPLIGVNTFLEPNAGEARGVALTRASTEEKQGQIEALEAFQRRNAQTCPAALERLRATVLSGANVFEELMHTVQVASLGQITRLLYEIGGEYRRAM